MVNCLDPPAFLRLKFANTLKEAGVPPAQAEAQATALSEVLEVNLKELVTKEDLHREIESLRQEMMAGFAHVDSRFIQLEQRLIFKLGGLMALSIGIVAGLVKLL
jgi:2-phosphoglycerate kinase